MNPAIKESLAARNAVARKTLPDRTIPDTQLHSPSIPRITALGGGHGLSVVLQGLRAYHLKTQLPDDEQKSGLSAIVTVADDGGNTGTLRKTLNIQALGDIRSSLLALSDGDSTIRDLFNFRFNTKLSNHSLGNLILAALTLMGNDFGEAVQRANQLLGVQGQVIPATTSNVELLAQFDNDDMIKGESKITAAERRIRKISLFPADVKASSKAVSAILNSDVIVIGPGSLYTSLIPNLLLDDIAQAIIASQSQVILVMNLMTEPGETRNYSAEDIIDALREHVPDLPIHTVLVNDAPIPEDNLRRYASMGIDPIIIDTDRIKAMGYTPVPRKLLARGLKIRHDPKKLAQALLMSSKQNSRRSPDLSNSMASFLA